MGGNTSVWSGLRADLLAVTVSTLVLVLVGVVIWQAFKTYQTKLAVDAQVAQAAAYRTLAEQSTRALEQTAEQLAHLQKSFTELNTRMTSIERVLKDVE